MECVYIYIYICVCVCVRVRACVWGARARPLVVIVHNPYLVNTVIK